MTAQGQDADLALRSVFTGLLDVAEDGIITVDERRRIVLFNHGAERLFGYSRSEVLGKELEVLLPERFVGTHPAQVEEFAKSSVTSRNMGERREVAGRRKNGEEFFADVSISKMLVDGRLLLTAIVRDATLRKQAEAELEQRVVDRTAALVDANRELVQKTEELRATTQQLWQAAKLASVGEMAASIAHELNNPLGIISLRLETVLTKTPADDPRRKPLEVVEQELDRMAKLVANLLHFSRPGKEEVSSVDVGEEVERTLELMHHHLTKRGIYVERAIGPGPVHILADRQKLRQVFLNLVSNAGDAMPAGGELTLTVRREPLADGKPGVHIEVSDTGQGIAADILPKVMDAFFTTKEEGKGTGLGLAICRRIVQEHKGTIAIDSAPGRGTRVRITLPAGTATNVNGLRG